MCLLLIGCVVLVVGCWWMVKVVFFGFTQNSQSQRVPAYSILFK